MRDGRKHWAGRETNRNLARERGLGVVGTRVVRPRTTATYGCDAETPPRRNACRRPHKTTGPGGREKRSEREKRNTRRGTGRAAGRRRRRRAARSSRATRPRAASRRPRRTEERQQTHLLVMTETNRAAVGWPADWALSRERKLRGAGSGAGAIQGATAGATSPPIQRGVSCHNRHDPTHTHAAMSLRFPLFSRDAPRRSAPTTARQKTHAA